MSLEKREMLIPMSSVNRTGAALKPTSVTIHNTANRDKGAGAISHAKYLVNRKEIAGWHWVVDKELSALCIPENDATAVVLLETLPAWAWRSVRTMLVPMESWTPLLTGTRYY